MWKKWATFYLCNVVLSTLIFWLLFINIWAVSFFNQCGHIESLKLAKFVAEFQAG